MTFRVSRLIVPAILAAAIPAAGVLAQTQARDRSRTDGSTAETLTRLQDGRVAMIKEALKLDEAQLKLWSPLEQQMRSSFAERQKARASRRERRNSSAERPSLPDRIDRAAQRMSERAERMKAYADAFRPFYASLTDDQKTVANMLLAHRRGFGHHYGRRWASRGARHRDPEER